MFSSILRWKVFISLFVVLVTLGAVPASATPPAVPYGSSGAAGAYPKPVFDWYQKNVFNNFTGLAGGYLFPDAPFDTPAFYPPHNPFFAGQIGLYTSTHDEIIAMIESLPKDYMRWDYVGNITTFDLNGGVYTPLLNFGYPVVVFSKGPNGPVFDPDELRALGKPIYFIEGPIHGNEMSGGEAAISMIRRLAYGEIKDSSGANVLDKVSAVIVPRLNVDGAYWNIRGSNIIRGQGRGMDQNRDGTMLHSPQSRLINMITNAYKPHLGIDIHEMGWSAPTGSPRYYPSGEYGVGSTVNIAAVTVANNTIDGSGTSSLNRHYTLQGWSPIDLGSKFHNTPKAISDWQDALLEYCKEYFASKNLYVFAYLLGTSNTYARKPDGVEVVSGDGSIVKMPGDVQQYFRNADCMPDEGYGDGALGLKQMIEFCAEVPSSAGDGYKTRVFFHYTAQEAELKFLAEHAQEILKDVEDARNSMKTDRSDVALWNLQTHSPSKHRVFKVIDGKIPDIPGDYYYEYTVPMHFHNKDRIAGKTVTRPYAYIIDPEQMAHGDKINADLAVFRLSYTGIPVYRLTEPVSVSVEGNTVGIIQGLGVGNTFNVTTPALSTFDAQGNFTGTMPTVSHDNVETTYLGGYDTAGSSFGIQTQRIVSATTAVETKTFPAGSYVIPVSGTLTNQANLHAMFALEVLGKRNLGNSYVRFTPGLHSATISSADLEQEWPYPYRSHYFPVEPGSKYPAYRYMSGDYETAMKIERVYTKQPFINGANYAVGYPVNISILKEKGFNLGTIDKMGLGYHFKAVGTTLTELDPKADNFYVTIPTKNDGVALGKWYLYNWSTETFVEATPGVSPRSGANIINVSGQFISSESDVVLIAAPSVAELDKLPYPDLSVLVNSGVTVKADQNNKSGAVTIEITNSGITDGESVLFYFVKGATSFNTIIKAVKEIQPGVFEVVFALDELGVLDDETTYAIQYSNVDGTVTGYSTFTNGAFKFSDRTGSGSGSGCNAGLIYATMGLFVVFAFARKRSK